MTMNDNIVLVGPTPPEGFVDDGCTMSPDGWWRRACRIHDYEYEEIRELYEQIKEVIAERKAMKYPETRYVLKLCIKRKRKRQKSRRKLADRNLRENIRLLSQGSRVKELFAWWVSRRYYGAVRRWGWLALRGPGHQGR